MVSKFELNLGSRKLSLDIDKVTVKKVKQLAKLLSDVKGNHNPLQKNPKISITDKNTGEERPENLEEWKQRIFGDYIKKLEKLPDETDDQYDQRVMALSMEDHVTTMAYEFLNGVCKLFSFKEVLPDEFEEGSWEKIRSFCHELISESDINDPDMLFFPPKRKEEAIFGKSL